jgi:hypothetical protein
MCLLLVLPLHLFFAIYIHGFVISKYAFIKFNVLKIQIVNFFFLMCYKFKILGTDAYGSLDHSDLTFKSGYNDILMMNRKTSLNLK